MKVNKLIYLIILILVFSLISFAQSEIKFDSESLEKGSEIINLARQAIYQKIPINDAKSFSIQLKRRIHQYKTTITAKDPNGDSYTIESESRSEQENIFSIEKPSKIRMNELLKTDENSGSKKLNIFNDNRIYAKHEQMDNGKYIDDDEFNLKVSKKFNLPFPKYNYKQGITKTYFSNKIQEHIFPLILYNFLDDSTKFAYLGKAESPTGKADIVSLIKENSPKGWEVKLFFDENTHFLLMITTTIGSSEDIFKNQKRYYFSNHKLVDGILIPQLIKTEERNSLKNDSNTSKTKIFEEINVVNFKVNPKFNEKEFEIKEENPLIENKNVKN